MYARVELRSDRSKEGRLTLSDGSVYRCLAKSDDYAAEAHGNPTRDTLKPFGDLPTGEYTAVRSVPKCSTVADARSYGKGPVWVLNPISGDALTALYSGRHGLLMHGGTDAGPLQPGVLRPTHGCLRVDDATIEAIALRAGDDKFTVVVVDIDANPGVTQ